MADEIATEYQPTRFYAVLVAVFSTSALALTSVGLFALLAHAASRRTVEMGLRLALGASLGSTVTLLLKAAFAPLAVGIAAGAGLALVVTRGIAGLLYGASRFDVVSVSTSVLLMVAVALAAGAIPARRVASIDPATILRSDS